VALQKILTRVTRPCTTINKTAVSHALFIRNYQGLLLTVVRCYLPNREQEEICEIDDELCHHTDSSGWEITVWPLQPDQNLEVEWAKKNIEHDALNSREEKGLTEDMKFTSISNFDKFWDWFAPN